LLALRQVDDTTGALHRTHRQLRQVVRVTIHSGVDIVCRASALVEGHVNLLRAVFIRSIVASTPLLHIRRSIPRNVCVVRESASELGLVSISLASATTSVLTLLISLVLSV
jgi:hypothetical protein